ncbi:MAG: hypothetical protein KAI66_26510, partial [Lentisphaeria bacterium]|nr:hypothetical protein [Lentisphaeria bacterium]
MNRVKMEKKGVVWGLWVVNERQAFLEAAKLCTLITYTEGSWRIFSYDWVAGGLRDDSAYWVCVWDQPAEYYVGRAVIIPQGTETRVCGIFNAESDTNVAYLCDDGRTHANIEPLRGQRLEAFEKMELLIQSDEETDYIVHDAGDYWRVGTNRWPKKTHCREKVGMAAMTLSSCDYCVDCTDCSNCSDLRDCEHCENCENCENSSYLRGCRAVNHSRNCDYCEDCEACGDLEHCADCEECEDLSYCHDMTACMKCHRCESCGNSEGLSSKSDVDNHPYGRSPFSDRSADELKSERSHVFVKSVPVENLRKGMTSISRDEFSAHVSDGDLIKALVSCLAADDPQHPADGKVETLKDTGVYIMSVGPRAYVFK